MNDEDAWEKRELLLFEILLRTTLFEQSEQYSPDEKIRVLKEVIILINSAEVETKEDNRA